MPYWTKKTPPTSYLGGAASWYSLSSHVDCPLKYWEKYTKMVNDASYLHEKYTG